MLPVPEAPSTCTTAEHLCGRLLCAFSWQHDWDTLYSTLIAAGNMSHSAAPRSWSHMGLLNTGLHCSNFASHFDGPATARQLQTTEHGLQEWGLPAHHHRHRGGHAAVLAELPCSGGAGQNHLHVHLRRRRQEAAIPTGVLLQCVLMCAHCLSGEIKTMMGQHVRGPCAVGRSCMLAAPLWTVIACREWILSHTASCQTTQTCDGCVCGPTPTAGQPSLHHLCPMAHSVCAVQLSCVSWAAAC